MTSFTLDPRLDADTHLIANHGSFSIRLMDDDRWPWIIVVPEVAGLTDMDGLDDALAIDLAITLSRLSAIVKNLGLADSTNVATLSNMVTQMHWHVVGRSVGDPGWPGPVWGHGERVPYAANDAAALVARLRAAWDKVAPKPTA
ncbi:HIT family protein [Ahrensia sp. R2A130]|uniref:HIT family protein n=1 Tax=Ahrensia sp. R2A130 TaxID=744979 RepID=UPI0001E0E07A|nr:HIT family protein [Ahrensia sp. R2A130]EFL89816.1 hypothetical protein R2A130_2428 [Ahrensia sp. R2A130]